MAHIELITAIDGVYPNGKVYYQKTSETFLKNDQISIGNITKKMQRKLKNYNPRWFELTDKDIYNWLLNDKPPHPRTNPLRIAEKDESQRTLRWSLEWKRRKNDPDRTNH